MLSGSFLKPKRCNHHAITLPHEHGRSRQDHFLARSSCSRWPPMGHDGLKWMRVMSHTWFEWSSSFSWRKIANQGFKTLFAHVQICHLSAFCYCQRDFILSYCTANHAVGSLIYIYFSYTCIICHGHLAVGRSGNSPSWMKSREVV